MQIDRNLQTLENELRHIARLVQGFETDPERIDAVAHSVNRALEALFDHAAPAVEEIPPGAPYPRAA